MTTQELEEKLSKIDSNLHLATVNNIPCAIDLDLPDQQVSEEVYSFKYNNRGPGFKKLTSYDQEQVLLLLGSYLPGPQEMEPIEKELFDKAIKIKLERGKNYGNGTRQAYDVALEMFPQNEETYVALWPAAQKLSRLMTLAEEKKNLDVNDEEAIKEWAKHWDDTSVDLINYVAMQWVRVCRPILEKKSVTKIFGNGKVVAEVPNDSFKGITLDTDN